MSWLLFAGVVPLCKTSPHTDNLPLATVRTSASESRSRRKAQFRTTRLMNDRIVKANRTKSVRAGSRVSERVFQASVVGVLRSHGLACAEAWWKGCWNHCKPLDLELSLVGWHLCPSKLLTTLLVDFQKLLEWSLNCKQGTGLIEGEQDELTKGMAAWVAPLSIRSAPAVHENKLNSDDGF